MKHDEFWRGPPQAIRAFAALNRDGDIMAASIRTRRSDVLLACGECVPIPVIVTYEAPSGDIEDGYIRFNPDE
jgi:hypothetical protein